MFGLFLYFPQENPPIKIIYKHGIECSPFLHTASPAYIAFRHQHFLQNENQLQFRGSVFPSQQGLELAYNDRVLCLFDLVRCGDVLLFLTAFDALFTPNLLVYLQHSEKTVLDIAPSPSMHSVVWQLM